MDQIPEEILSYIFELATANDRVTACQLCLVNQSVGKIALPLLYKHVCLFSTNQVESFNATIGSSPKLGDLIHGMTLSDDKLALASLEFVYDTLRNESLVKGGWVKHWKKLVRYLGVLSQRHFLKRLIISKEACCCLYYFEINERDGNGKTLSDILKQSKLQLDHLVISHASLKFFLTAVKTNKLTWYGCDLTIDSDALNVCKCCPMVSNQLQEVTFTISDNHDHVHPAEGDEDEFDEDLDEDRHHRAWPSEFASKIQELCETQNQTLKVSAFLHVQTQEAREQMIEELNNLEVKVNVGEWGKTSDTSHHLAQLKSFASKGWIHKDDVNSTIGTEVAAQGKDGDDSKNDSENAALHGCWEERQPLGNEWCGCTELKPGPEVDVDEDFDWPDGLDPSWDAWSDNSDNWDPMQRHAFLSGESHHYSQAYIDRYAL